MLECSLKERHLLRAKLCREAEQLIEDVEKEAMTKWIEAQEDEWNGWDHLYPVTAEVKRGKEFILVKVQLSSNVIRIALKECRSKISTLIETRRIEKLQETLFPAFVAEYCYRPPGGGERRPWPRQRFEIPVPFSAVSCILLSLLNPQPADSRSPRTQRSASGKPKRSEEADAGGAAAKSAKKSCNQNAQRESAETGRNAVRNQRKRQARKAQEQRADQKRPRLGDALQSHKRRRAGPSRPTYIPRADLLEKDHDQLVDEIFMRMTPRQLETRCTLNKVHFVLSEQQRRNPFWSQPATLTLLGRGPRFIPKARALSTT